MTWNEAEVGMTIWSAQYGEPNALRVEAKTTKTLRVERVDRSWHQRINCVDIGMYHLTESGAWVAIVEGREANIEHLRQRLKNATSALDKARASLAACLEREGKE